MNSASLRSFSNLSAAAGRALWPSAVVIPGHPDPIPATIVPPRETFGLELAGEIPLPVTLTVRILKSDLVTAPAAHTFLTWDSKRWKIRAVDGSDRPTEAEHTLTCAPAP